MGSQSFDKNTASRGNLWQFDPKSLVVIGVDTNDGPEHELYDERAFLPLDDSMTASMMDMGVKQSVTIRKNPATGKAEVVDGRRRVLHAREANKKLKKAGDPLIKVPCILEHGSEERMQETAIALNEIRYEDPMMIKVAKCQRLLERNGNDFKAAARAFGVTTAAIKNWVKVSELTPKVRKAIDKGEISASAAAQLHGMEKEAQIAELEKLTADAKKAGKKKATTKSAKKAAGKKTAVGKRVLMKLITDEEIADKVDPAIVFGIKLALGEHVPAAGSKFGRLLEKAGHTY